MKLYFKYIRLYDVPLIILVDLYKQYNLTEHTVNSNHICDANHTGQPKTSRMNVNSAQKYELILETDMWEVTSLTIMRK
jgi:hypothetical protein